jgi:2-succinyl-6-hydroxy-2,4-cyclohexadiene-1-carboxylate synthase
VRVPVTLVVGERDAKFRDVAERMAPLLRDGRVVVAPGAGHAVHLEAPGEVARAIVGEGAGTAAG